MTCSATTETCITFTDFPYFTYTYMLIIVTIIFKGFTTFIANMTYIIIIIIIAIIFIFVFIVRRNNTTVFILFIVYTFCSEVPLFSALIQEIRQWFDGPVALSGSIASGDAVLAAQAMGADFAYIGSAFIATHEARAAEAYKQAIVDCNSDDIVYSNLFTGVHGNYLAPSIKAAGLDPSNLPVSDPSAMNFGGDAKKAWKDIWGCGQGIGAVDAVVSTADFVAKLKQQYASARARLAL